MSLWKVWRYNLTVKSIIKAKWKGNNPKYLLIVRVCVCARELMVWVAEGIKLLNKPLSRFLSFSVRCVFFFCVCVRERARERQVYAFGLRKVCDCMCVSCSPQCCASLRHTVNCQDGVTSSSWPADGVEVNGSEQEESVCVRKLLKYTNDCTLCALQFLPQLT